MKNFILSLIIFTSPCILAQSEERRQRIYEAEILLAQVAVGEALAGGTVYLQTLAAVQKLTSAPVSDESLGLLHQAAVGVSVPHELRAEALKALAIIASPKSVATMGEVVRQALRMDTEVKRVSLAHLALEGLIRLRPPEAAAIYQEVLKFELPEDLEHFAAGGLRVVQDSALYALAQLHLPETYALLEHRFQTESPISSSTLEALGAYGDRRGIELILNHFRRQVEPSNEVQKMIFALGAIATHFADRCEANLKVE